LYLAATNPYFGLQIFQNQATLDLNGDGIISQPDVDLISAAVHTLATGPDDPRDLDRDGVIEMEDVQLLGSQCLFEDCASTPGEHDNPTPPKPHKHGPESLAADGTRTHVHLQWTPTENTLQYHVYRSETVALIDFVPPTLPLTLPGGLKVTLQDIQNGALNNLCTQGGGENAACELSQAVQTDARLDKPMHWLGTTVEHEFTDSTAPETGATYVVVAEDTNGNLSEASNIVSAPDVDDPIQPPAPAATYEDAAPPVEEFAVPESLDPSVPDTVEEVPALIEDAAPIDPGSVAATPEDLSVNPPAAPEDPSAVPESDGTTSDPTDATAAPAPTEVGQ
jgi:hypothetical protein